MIPHKNGISALLLVILLSILAACTPLRNASRSESQESLAPAASRILFLNYQLSRDDTSNSYDARLINMIIKDGSLKEDRPGRNQAKKDDLEVLVLDKNQQIMSYQHIPNPLDKSVEYVNDAGQLEQKMVHLDSIQFSVRMQIEPEASIVHLRRYSENNTEETVLLQTRIQ